jgi:TRAP-type mannitol/chloroaromatic compound transport system substrate-binding protein
MEEVNHIINVLESTKSALQEQNIIQLKDLSNQTIHCASTEQDLGSILIAIVVYSLGKLLEKKDSLQIKNWNKFIKKFNAILDLAIKAAKEGNEERYEAYLGMARKTLSSLSVNLKPYIEEVMRKASINKASKIYEHGISLGQTANLLGISQWELSEYTGQTSIADTNYNNTINTKKRAQMAMEFFG